MSRTMIAAKRTALRASLWAVALTLAGCSSMPSWLGGGDKKILPLPAVSGSASVTTGWQTAIGSKQTSSLIPAVANGRVYAAHPSGAVIVADEIGRAHV